MASEEPPAPKTTAELSDMSNWVHYTREINAKYGRSVKLPPKVNEAGEDEPWEGEEFVDPLRAISEDTQQSSSSISSPSWRIDRVPNTTSPAVGEIAAVRSLNWPGAVTLGVGKKFVNVYVGYGLKATQSDHQVQLPAKLAPDFGITASSETGGGNLTFTNLQEQPDVLVDPSPPEEGSES